MHREKVKVTIIGSVYETYNYEMFKFLDGNRCTSKGHVKDIANSMAEMYLVSPVIINGGYYIIDGQHRFEAARKLGLPVRYIIDQKAGLRAVQLLNAKSKDWVPNDYMESYIKEGSIEYVGYKSFYQKYKLPHVICQALLSGSFACKTTAKRFNNGEFKINTLDFAEKVGCLVLESMQYYEGSKRRSYVFAIAQLMKKSNFNEKEFLRKLKAQRAKMYDCAKTVQYIELIEHIYNYRNKNKVNLRY